MLMPSSDSASRYTSVDTRFSMLQYMLRPMRNSTDR